jgi:hypothetical protein
LEENRAPGSACWALFLTTLFLATPLLRGADAAAGTWYLSPDLLQNRSVKGTIAGNEVTLQASADQMLFCKAGSNTVLTGDFEITARIELLPAAAQPGCNRRANLLLASLENGQSGRQQVYVGIYQKTAGTLVPTGGAYSLITNMVIGGQGGRFSTHPTSQEAPGGLFKIVRRGDAITTYYFENNAWIQFSQWTGGFPDKLQPSFQVDNKWEATTACAVTGRMVCTPGNTGGGQAAQTGSSVDTIGKAIVGLGKLLDTAATTSNTRPASTEADAKKAPASGLDQTIDKLNRATNKLDAAFKSAPPTTESPTVSQPPTAKSQAAVPPRTLPSTAPSSQSQAPANRAREIETTPAAAAVQPTPPAAPASSVGLPVASVPAASVGPLMLADFEEGKWPNHASAPWAPAGSATTPLPRSWSVAPSAIAPVYDINRLTPGDYDGMVKTAMAGMRMVMGEITPEQEMAFEANWAPLLEYPCQEALDYLVKFNPLCSQFQVAQAAFAETAKAYDRAQAELLLATSEADGDSVLSASETMRSTKNLLLAHSNTMTAVAKAIQDLGPLPNPLTRKKAARQLHDQAMQMLAGEFAIVPAEITVAPGEKIDFSFTVPGGINCESVQFQGQYYKPDEKVRKSFVNLGTYAVQAVPYSKMKPIPGIKAVAVVRVKQSMYFSDKLRDCPLGSFSFGIRATVSALYEDGQGKRVPLEESRNYGCRVDLGDEERSAFIKWQGMEFSFEDTKKESGSTTLTLSAGGTISPDGTSILALRVKYRSETKEVPPDFPMTITETNSCEFKNIPMTSIGGGVAVFSLKPEELAAHIVAAQWTRHSYGEMMSPGIPAGCWYRTYTLKEIQREAADRGSGLLLGLHVTSVKRQGNPGGAPWEDIAENFKIGGTEGAEANLPPEMAALLAQARNEAAKSAKAEQDMLEKEKADRIKFHEANIHEFEQLAASLRSELSAAKGDVARENLSWQIMVAESNLQKEKDHIAMIRTGQWVNTRTTFDDYIPPQVAEEAQARAQVWGQANRILEMANRQIALAPPEDRDRLLSQFNQSVALAKGDPNKVIHAGKTLFDQVQGHYEAEQGKTEEDLIDAEQKLKFAENVKTVSDTSLMVLGTVATAGGGGTLLYGQLTAEVAVQSGYGVGCGYIEGGLPEAFKQGAAWYSTAALAFSNAMDAYHEGVLENLRAHAEKPEEVAIDETGAGWKNAAWTLAKEAAKAAAMKLVVEPAAVTLRRSLQSGRPGVRVANVSGVNMPQTAASANTPSASSSRGAKPREATVSGVNWDEGIQPGKKWPTVEQRLAEAGFRAQQAEGRAKVNLFKERCEAAAEARRKGAPPEEVERLRAKAEEAYKVVKTDYHSKTVLKKVAELGSNRDLVRYYNFYDKKNMASLIQEVNTSLAEQKISPQHLEFISNSASKGGIGMDIDMHANDPARMLGEGKDRMPNPEYAKWRNELVETLGDGSKRRLSPEEFRGKAQIALKQGFERVYGRSSEQVFPTFTTKDYAEAYKDKAWLGLKGESHADFPNVQPLWTGQAADVTGFKVNSLPHEHASLGTYTILQEQSRGILKDLDTKVFGAKSDRSKFGNETGADITINPAGPLAKATPQVQQHFMELRRVLREFANNNIGPIEADRRLRELTGGRGIPEVADRLSVVLTANNKR